MHPVSATLFFSDKSTYQNLLSTISYNFYLLRKAFFELKKSELLFD